MFEPWRPSSVQPPASSPIPTQPMTVSQILDRIFRLMRANLRLFLGIASVPTILMFVFLGAIFGTLFAFNPHGQQTSSEQMQALMAGSFMIVALAGSVLAMIAYALYEAAGTHAALQADAGVRISFREAWELALRRPGRYIWLMVLRILYYIAPIFLVVIALVAVIFLAHGAGWAAPLAMSLAYVAIIVGAIVLTVRLSLAYPASVAENLGARAAIRRSFELTRRAKGRIFLVILLISLLSYAAIFILELALSAVIAVGALFIAALHLSAAWKIGGEILVGIIAAVAFFFFAAGVAALHQIAFAVHYQDQRRRVEGAIPSSPRTS